MSIEPEKSFPFIVGPCDMDMLSEMNQSYFIRYFEAARCATIQLDHRSITVTRYYVIAF